MLIIWRPLEDLLAVRSFLCRHAACKSAFTTKHSYRCLQVRLKSRSVDLWHNFILGLVVCQ